MSMTVGEERTGAKTQINKGILVHGLEYNAVVVKRGLTRLAQKVQWIARLPDQVTNSEVHNSAPAQLPPTRNPASIPLSRGARPTVSDDFDRALCRDQHRFAQ